MWWGCARGTRVAVVVVWCGYMGYGMRVRAGGDWLAGRCGVVGCVGAKTGENGGKVCLVWCGRWVGWRPVEVWLTRHVHAVVVHDGGSGHLGWAGRGHAGKRCCRGRPEGCLSFLSFVVGWDFLISGDLFLVLFFGLGGEVLICFGVLAQVVLPRPGWAVSPAASPRPGHVHAAGVGGGASAGHRVVAAHGRPCRGGWVRGGGRGKGAPASGYGPCVVQVSAVGWPAMAPDTGCT